MNTRIKALFFVAVAATCWVSCKKSNDNPPATSSLSVVGFFNLSSNNINFYVNGTRINNTTTYYPGGTLGYLNVIAGTQNYAIKTDGSTTPFYEKALKFDSGSGYSVYVGGKTADDIFYTQDLWIPDTGANLTKYAQIRYVNASATAGEMSFVLRGKTDSAQFDAVAYKATTAFKRINSGIHYIGVYRAAFPTVPKVDTVTLTAGKIYTFYGYGTPASGNLGILAGLFNNG